MTAQPEPGRPRRDVWVDADMAVWDARLDELSAALLSCDVNETMILGRGAEYLAGEVREGAGVDGSPMERVYRALAGLCGLQQQAWRAVGQAFREQAVGDVLVDVDGLTGWGRLAGQPPVDSTDRDVEVVDHWPDDHDDEQHERGEN